MTSCCAVRRAHSLRLTRCRTTADILGHSAVFGWLLNSAIVSLAVTLGVLVLSSLAGYGFARLRFPGRDVIFILVLFGLAIPEQSVIIARHQMFTALHLHNTYGGLILPGLAAPFGVFLMTQYFRACPKELEEAAWLDGASHFKTFWRIVLPLSIARAGDARHLYLPIDLERLLVAADLGHEFRHVHPDRGRRLLANEFCANQRPGFSHGAGGLRQRSDSDRLRDLSALHRRRRIARGGVMTQHGSSALAVWLPRCWQCQRLQATNPTEPIQITLQRFFGACDAEYGNSTDVRRRGR